MSILLATKKISKKYDFSFSKSSSATIIKQSLRSLFIQKKNYLCGIFFVVLLRSIPKFPNHSITAVVPPKTHHPKLIYQKPEPYFKTGIFLFTSEEEIPKDNVLCIQTAVELTSLFQRNLNQGISISKQLWNSLTKQAKKVLVQSTVESREGAGEDKNLVDPEDITTF